MIGLVPYYPMSLSAPQSRRLDAGPAAGQRGSERIGAAVARHLCDPRLPQTISSASTPSSRRRRASARDARASPTSRSWAGRRANCADSERAVFEACLFESGRPLLIVPAAPSVSRPAAAGARRVERLARGGARRARGAAAAAPRQAHAHRRGRFGRVRRRRVSRTRSRSSPATWSAIRRRLRRSAPTAAGATSGRRWPKRPSNSAPD